MATISPFHHTQLHTVGSRAFRWLLLFVWAAALSGGPLLAVGSAQEEDHYKCDADDDGDMRLGAGEAHTGNVEICHEEGWRFVCDDGFGEEEAKVVCGHLSNDPDTNVPALPAYTLSYWNPYASDWDSWNEHTSSRKFWLDDLECLGTEASLAECAHREWGEYNCGASERAGVWCGIPPLSLSVDKATIAEGERATVTFTVIDSDYVTDEDRTVHFWFTGSTAAEGDFLLDGRRTYHNAQPLTLEANEAELTATITAKTDSAAEGAETITVTALYLGLTVSAPITITAQENPDTIGQEGALRLLDKQGRPTEGRGRVQIYHAGQWGNICGIGFHDTDTFSLSSAGDYEAHVACKQLGYETGTLWNYASDARGLLSEFVWLSELYCREDDSRLVECGRGMAWGETSCRFYESAGVSCIGERSNQPPVPTVTVSGRTHMQAQPFSYTIDAFTDPEGQPLTYTAELEDGGALPAWLIFDPTTRTFTAEANAATKTVGVRVIATDPGEDADPSTTDDNLSASVVFTILVITSENRDSIVGRAMRSPDENDASRVETYTLPPQDSAGDSAGGRTSARNTDSAVTEWSLDRSEDFCDDADQFTIAPDVTDSDRATLTFRESPDYENPADCDGDNTYEVTVRATRGTATFTRDVTVTVQNVDDVLMVVEGPAEYVENDTEEPVTLELTGVSGPVTWSLATDSNAGCDAARFNMDGGTLTFREPPDHENPTDCDRDNTYEVTVRARAGADTFERTLTIRITDGNDPPQFVDAQEPSFDVPENSESDFLIGTVAATDPNDDSLTYSLSGVDDEFFTIDSRSGELRTTAALDYEQPEDADSGNAYEVEVLVSDGKNPDGTTDADETADARLPVTITVTNVNEGPEFADNQDTSFEVPENSGSSFDIGTVAAMADPENDRLTYSLAGVDNEFFTINSGGELRPDLDAALNYEQPGDEDGKNTYEVAVLVSDHKNPDGTTDADKSADARRPLTITVTDVDEDGTVSLDPDPPQALAPLMATLNDPDRDSGRVTWKWERSEDSTGPWDIINGESEARYTPSLDDTGDFLRATARYTDRLSSSNQTAEEVSDQVRDAPFVGLRLSSNTIAEGGTTEVTAMLAETVGVSTVVTLLRSPAFTFTPNRATLTIPANMRESTETVTLTAEDNAVDEGARRLRVKGRPSDNSRVAGVSWATLTITDDDTRGVMVSQTELSIREKENDEYTVKLNSEPTEDVTVTPAIDQTDAAVERVRPEQVVFTKSNWNTPQTVTVEADDDEVSNANPKTATITHTVTGGDYEDNNVPADPVAVTVTDDESPSTTVTLSVNRETVQEGDSERVTVTGKLDGAPAEDLIRVTVLVTSESDPAVSNLELVSSFTLTIEPGETSGTYTFDLKTTNDTIDKPDETVMVDGMVTGLNVTPTTLTITDNDDPPTVELELSSDSIAENGGTSTVTATLTGKTTMSSVETVVTLDDSQAFNLSGTTLTIPANMEESGGVTLTTVDNDEFAPHQTVRVSGSVTSYDLPGTPKLVEKELTIRDDEGPTVRSTDETRTIYEYEYTEGERTPVDTYTATNPDSRNISIEWSLGGDDADKFSISRAGVLSFQRTEDFPGTPDYEDPNNRDREYRVTVIATATEGTTTRNGSQPVTVEVMDKPGTLSLDPPQPRAGQTVTATLEDPDDIDDIRAITWRWEWALDDEAQDFEWQQFDVEHTADDAARTSTFRLPSGTADRYLRVRVDYEDGDRTYKQDVQIISDAVQPALPSVDTPGRRPSGPSGPSGGGGGGGPTCADDLHGNTSTQATDIALATETVGAICPAEDVDYFIVSAPDRGLVFVDTPGNVNLRGTMWQDGAELASGPTGRGQGARLGARVEAGDVVVAVAAQGGATGEYDLAVTFSLGFLENPGPNSFQSGIGVISGWVCEADAVEIEIEPESGAVLRETAAYGTERADTATRRKDGTVICGDTDNGFGLLFNWNRLGDGEHTVVALVDGVELGRATVTVTTLDEEFLRDVAGECLVADFPLPGETVTVEWQETQQNFVMTRGMRPDGTNLAGMAGVGYLENPGPNSFQSGVGVISGWVCEAEVVEIAIGDMPRQVAAYGTERLDTAAVRKDGTVICGDTDNGFGLLFNWNRLGDGEHAVVAYVDGEVLGRATVRVTTLGEEFLRGAEGECVVEDFPMPGETVTLEWQQNSQNFVMTDAE